MESVQVGKDIIQNDVMEEASTSHADSTAPPNAASSTLQQISKEKPLRNQLTEQVRSANTSKNESSITSSNTVMSFQQQTWIEEDKTNLSNSITTQKEPVMTEPLVQNLPTGVSSTTPSNTHDINMLTPNMKNLNTPGQYTTDSANFSSPSTPLDSSPSGTFNQFSVNTDKTNSGQQNNPNAAKAKPFVCNVCNQTFSRQHNLKSHALTHSQEKPFQCEICHHFFRRHHDLKRHAKLHTGEKPYQCQHCKRKFARLDALNRHLRAESFCGGPQKKLFQNSESKLEPTSSPQPPLQPPPQQPVPQPQQTIQPQTKPQLDQKQNSQQITPQLQQQQQYKQSVEDLQKKQAQNQPNNNTSVTKNEISFQRQQQVIQEQYHWAQQPTQQLSQIQSMPQSNNTQSLQGKQANIVMTNQSHRQIIFPVDTTTTTTTNPHYKMQYAINKPIQEPQRRVSEIMMTNDQDVDVHPNNGKSSQLIERNSYLEERVRELENEVINERKLRSRREYLEKKVNELEIEKNLLKQLLLERDTGSSDISHIEKKRKTTLPIDSSKHQKD
uniref:Transcriptional regulator CRZ1 n=1 Tax=Anthurium amnicola TaxID=1678845 RepID=A0A1D1ZAQ4_9ARAE